MPYNKFFYYARKIFHLFLLGLFLIINLFPKKYYKTIVICQRGKLGDLICTTPLFRLVKKYYPDHKLVVIAREPFHQILEHNPYINCLISFSAGQLMSSYTWVLRTGLMIRHRFHPDYFVNLFADFNASLLGVVMGAEKKAVTTTALDGKMQKIFYPFFNIRPYDYTSEAKIHYLSFFDEINPKSDDLSNELFFTGNNQTVELWSQKNNTRYPLIGVTVSSGKDFKHWPQKSWIELLKKLMLRYHAQVVFFGVSEELEEIKRVSDKLPGQNFIITDVPINELPHYIKKCHLFIGVDTGPLYIADALKVPTVDIMGPCDEKTQKPDYGVIVTNQYYCHGQSKVLSQPKLSDYPAIKQCFESITPQQVFSSCQHILERGNN